MPQIKIFKGIESDVDQLETEINQWLAESQVRVIQMFGNISPQSPSAQPSSGLSKSHFAPSDVFMVVLYEKSP